MLFEITDQDLMRLMSERREISDQIPDNSEFVGVYYDFVADTFSLKVKHPSFFSFGPGEELPRKRISIKSPEDGQNTYRFVKVKD